MPSLPHCELLSDVLTKWEPGFGELLSFQSLTGPHRLQGSSPGECLHLEDPQALGLWGLVHSSLCGAGSPSSLQCCGHVQGTQTRVSSQVTLGRVTQGPAQDPWALS